MIEVNIRSYDVITAALPEDMRLDRSLGKPLVVELEDGAKVMDIFKKLPWLGRPHDDTILVFINGQAEMLYSELHSGDTIDIMTPSGGG
jgi:hypothetical protein